MAALYTGIGAFSRELVVAFRDAPPRVLPASYLREIQTVEQLVPVGEALLYIRYDEFWNPHLLQRALYPRNPVVPWRPGDPGETLSELRLRHGIRFVVWSGTPPRGLAFAWQRELPGLPPDGGPMHLGALAP